METINTELTANLRTRGNLLALSLLKYCNVSAPAAARMVWQALPPSVLRQYGNHV
jgi:hypothetical protein